MPVSLEQFERDVRSFLANVQVLAEVVGQAGAQLETVPQKFLYLRPAADGLQHQLASDSADIEQQLTPGPRAEPSLSAPRPSADLANYAQELQRFIARLPELAGTGVDLSRTLVTAANEGHQLPYVRRRIAVLASDIVKNGSYLNTTSYDLGVAGGVKLDTNELMEQFAALRKRVDRAREENRQLPIDVTALLVATGAALTEMETAADYAIRIAGEKTQGRQSLRPLHEASEELRSLEAKAAVSVPEQADWDPAIDAIHFHRLHTDMAPEAISAILEKLRLLRERAADHNAFHDSQPHTFAHIRKSAYRIAPQIYALAETLAALGAAAAQAPEVRELTRQLGTGPNTETFALTEEKRRTLHAAFAAFNAGETPTATPPSVGFAVNSSTPGANAASTLPALPWPDARKPGRA